MKLFKIFAAAFVAFFCFSWAGAQKKDQTWQNVAWCITEGAHPNDYGVYLFRRTFELKEVPKTFVVDVSADNRYRLFVNGKSICFGPARGDLNNWYYETIDIAPFLKTGKNVISAEVWNAGKHSPCAQVSRCSAFLFRGRNDASFLNTPNDWKSIRNEGRFEVPYSILFVGPNDGIDASKYPWGWQEIAFDDSSWKGTAIPAYMPKAQEIASTGSHGELTWTLRARDIPLMQETTQKMQSIAHSEDVKISANFLKGEALTIPANTKCSILVDNGTMTTAYPRLTLSGGKGAKVEVKYAEAMVNKNGLKENRAKFEGMQMPRKALRDVFLPDGGSSRTFSTLWMRVYRFVELQIETKDSPLVIENYDAVYTGYPFEENAKFSSDDKSLDAIWEVAWRTLRLCAHETYFDCPYYEQMQYVGDTRIQALITLYVSGDDRLMRKAIHLFNQSRHPCGLTSARYPNRVDQIIPPFSLYWINMIGDFMRHRSDENFVAQNAEGVRSVMNYFLSNIDEKTGILKANMPYWNFVDWSGGFGTNKKNTINDPWWRGTPPESDTSGSAIITLQLVDAMRDAAKIMKFLGRNSEAQTYAQTAEKINEAVYKSCWNAKRGLLADYADGKDFSQHANIMGILTDAIPAEKQQEVLQKVLNDKSLEQCTFYYRFYLARAVKKLGGNYTAMLQDWKDMIAEGFTTFPENPGKTRSDCHAWSSSPNYDFLATICGIMPDADGFKKVKIEPLLGYLKEAQGQMPHPCGEIKVRLKRIGNSGIKGEVELPENISGRFVWNGKEIALQGGKTEIEIK